MKLEEKIRAPIRDYPHQGIGTEIRSISGYLTVLEEIRLNHGGRALLCIVSVGVIDNACCGAGGCLSIEIPGYILSSEKNEQGQQISRVIPVEDQDEKTEIAAVLNKLYPYAQLCFG